ncbi:MAG: hypothetical protein FJZ59_02160 [Chlamydiae bacterium]|nr:hypothetical protein [Chlamydiota bacterium]
MQEVEKIFDDLVSYQKSKLLKVAREIKPSVVADDLMQPFDFPELENHPEFRYEEGVLAGLLTAYAALQAAKDEITCLK